MRQIEEFRTWLRNSRHVPWHVRLLARFGYWDWEHEFRSCPSGERHCPHVRYRLGREKP